MQVEIISSRAAFDALKDEWNAMPQALRSPLARHEWFAAALTAFSAKDELAIYVARQDGKLRAIAPLVVDRAMGSLRLNIIAHQTHEPGEFLYADEAALAAVCNAIMASGRPAVIPRIALDAPELRLLTEAPRRGPTMVRPVPMATSRLPLTTFKALESAMTSSARNKLKRRRKLAEHEGKVTAEVIVPDAGNMQRHLGEVFRLEGAGWKSQAGTSMLEDQAMRRFYTYYAKEALRLGMLRFYFLRVGDTTVAARLAVAYDGKLWDLKIGYDERLKNCAPGILLTHETLRLACEEGLKGFEFLGIAEAWQDRWPIESWQHTTLRYYPVSLGGGLSFGVDMYRFGGQRLKAAFERRDLPKELQAAS